MCVQMFYLIFLLDTQWNYGEYKTILLLYMDFITPLFSAYSSWNKLK